MWGERPKGQFCSPKPTSEERGGLWGDVDENPRGKQSLRSGRRGGGRTGLDKGLSVNKSYNARWRPMSRREIAEEKKKEGK